MNRWIFIVLLFSLIVSPSAFALQEYEVEHDFMPDEFIFEYNNHQSKISAH